ncbi:flagellar assembly peptidoglycan hydrolase FlgJ [Thalassotalea sp. LPB0316]|uniref:flagellar assembly peptidoglycan hydrolase FlgJ n=1 Tax=Thalassotalea sp. LPB0316 TaxID=2769490 RepID=UPI001865F2BF|nr:flagellar assembly peptidoglycan hydrolase FlgJ [Thalassotalea sp. LPB0316]QOL27069.1 flagellar assembly peptidoglycan hydrolase FlgJ [Thalassotalea sp. LPB0316]
MKTPGTEATNFFDLTSLNNIRQQSKADDKASKDQALETAAKQFEAIFMQMLLKSMRSAQEVLEADSPFNSQNAKFYRDMHDQQLALELSNNGSLGLSDLIVRQLGGKQDDYMPSSVLRSDGNLVVRSDRQVAVGEQKAERPFGEIIDKAAQNVQFEQPEDFVKHLTQPAKAVEQALGIPYQVVIAQSALETGWGKKIIQKSDGQSSNNLFNIKADSRWQGDKANKDTLEFENGMMTKKNAPFRVYESIKDSVNDYIDFLSNNDRYQEALNQTSNVEQFLHGLQKAGYATDPQYANKIIGTLKRVTSILNN